MFEKADDIRRAPKKEKKMTNMNYQLGNRNKPYRCKSCGKEMWSLNEVVTYWDDMYCKKCDPEKKTEQIEIKNAKETIGSGLPKGKKEPANYLDKLIFAIYGNPPSEKTAKTEEAARMAFEELLMGAVSKDEVDKLTAELNEGPMPYSTHDLALSVALN